MEDLEIFKSKCVLVRKHLGIGRCSFKDFNEPICDGDNEAMVNCPLWQGKLQGRK